MRATMLKRSNRRKAKADQTGKSTGSRARSAGISGEFLDIGRIRYLDQAPSQGSRRIAQNGRNPDRMQAGRVAGYGGVIQRMDDSAERGQEIGEGGSKTIFYATPELKAHIKERDPLVPRKRGIGGAHNREEFSKNDVFIEGEGTPSKISGVRTVEYRMAKLNIAGEPTGEYGMKVFRKTIYDPSVISDDEYIERGLEAANDARESNNGEMPREWSGVDSKGIRWHGYCEHNEITSFFPVE